MWKMSYWLVGKPELTGDGLLDNLELSLEAGIGGYVFHQGRILWRDSAEGHSDPEIEREFSLLGVQVVIPILDRQTLRAPEYVAL